MKIGAALLGSCCLLLGACSNPSSDLDFHGPAGWRHLPAVMGFESWSDPSGSGSMVMLRRPNETKPSFRHEINLRICRGHPAHWYKPIVDQNNGKPVIVEGVDTYWGKLHYMAVYIRPPGTAPDPAAEAAIRSICLKASP